MELNEKLQQAGLTGNESKVYLELIKKGELSANQISKNTGMDRTLTYTILNHLIEKGQVNYIIKESKKIFSASSPENLLNSVKSKEILILDLIKQLNEVKTEKQDPIEIKVYEGKEGFRTFMNVALKEKEMFSFGGTGRAYDLLYEMPAVAKQMKKVGIHLKVILGKPFAGHDFTKYENVLVRLSEIKSESTTSIFGDYISIHLLKDKPIVILIKNKDIAESYRNYFQVLWKNAKP